jgi:hypothetical protein
MEPPTPPRRRNWRTRSRRRSRSCSGHETR